jgi:hypothetical protein
MEQFLEPVELNDDELAVVAGGFFNNSSLGNVSQSNSGNNSGNNGGSGTNSTAVGVAGIAASVFV